MSVKGPRRRVAAEAEETALSPHLLGPAFAPGRSPRVCRVTGPGPTFPLQALRRLHPYPLGPLGPPGPPGLCLRFASSPQTFCRWGRTGGLALLSAACIAPNKYVYHITLQGAKC